PDTVNTVPPATLDAYREIGQPAATLADGIEAASRSLDALSALGIDLDTITETLEAQGVASFDDAFARLLAAIDSKRAALAP
ncbi:MAG: transaldolase family protein, partial [Pseudomonadota bacterium]